jgi:two-component system, sensor histidine kinase LadS
VLSLLWHSPQAQLHNAIELDTTFGRYLIHKELYIYDEQNNLPESIEQVLAKPERFRQSATKINSYFVSYAGHWFRFQLRSTIDQPLVLDIGNFTVDALDLYLIDSAGKIKRFQHLNWRVPPRERVFKSIKFAYLIDLKSSQNYTVFVRIRNQKGTMLAPITISKPAVYFEGEHETYNFFNFFLGVAVIVIVLSVSFFCISKDLSYLYYSLFVFFLVLHNACINGLFVEYLSEHLPQMADTMNANLFSPFFGIFHLLFLQKIIFESTSTWPYWYTWLRNVIIAVGVVVLLMLVLCLFNEFFYSYTAYMSYVCYTLILIHLVVILVLGYKQNKDATIFIIVSNIPFIVYTSLLIIRNLKVVNLVLPNHALLWCLLFDIIILSIGLSFRFRAAARRELQLQRQINTQLNLTFEAEKKHQQEQIQRLEAQYKLQVEKERISRDLHDNIGSQLAFITSNIDYYSGKMNESPELQQKLNNLSDYVRVTTQQLRDTIWATSKENIALNDFVKRIRNYVAKQIENHEDMILEIDYDEEEADLSSNQALNLFRVVQEAVNNVLKHSEATLIALKIKHELGDFSVEIIDNGKGFDTKLQKPESYGIENMKNRIEDLKGELTIVSAPKKGTKISIKI